MTYEAFKKELYRNLSQEGEALGKQVRLYEKRSICADIRDMSIIKAMNMSSYGKADILVHEDVICVLWGQQERLSMIHWKVHSLYECYKREGWQSVLPELVTKMKHVGIIGDSLTVESATYEENCARLILRPVNYHRNRMNLNNCIYWRRGDIALVLYGVISDNGKDYLTIKIHREITKRWNIPDNTLLMNALLNSCAKLPPRLLGMEDIMTGANLGAGVFMPGEKGRKINVRRPNSREGIWGYRLTNERQLNGALSIFYPGVKKRIGELFGEDYYIGFTSIHEAVIHPVSAKCLEDMKAAIGHVNAVFDEQEMLTNRVYRYSCKKGEMEEV